MPGLDVTPPEVNESGTRLSGIAADVSSAHAAVAGTSGAADGTSLSGAYEELLGHFAAVLPHYGHASNSVSAALGAAGTSYASTETALQSGFAAGEKH